MTDTAQSTTEEDAPNDNTRGEQTEMTTTPHHKHNKNATAAASHSKSSSSTPSPKSPRTPRKLREYALRMKKKKQRQQKSGRRRRHTMDDKPYYEPIKPTLQNYDSNANLDDDTKKERDQLKEEFQKQMHDAKPTKPRNRRTTTRSCLELMPSTHSPATTTTKDSWLATRLRQPP